ncbi:hypothetical protein [Candidatus Protochlamydia phocaeensis]|uniref:hypothetical protein n=1 Tax=Candidatus Protochlamydia phocaeensis TaxID=1414722 RepID=UPI000AA144C2|nr:hypothetical protein [Candidatus Protochlamydia phocaeensis]
MPKEKKQQIEELFVGVQTFPALFRLINQYESHARKTRSVALTKFTNSSRWKKFRQLSPSLSTVKALCTILTSMPQRDLISYEVYPNHLMKLIVKKILSAPVGAKSLIELTSLCYQKLGHQVFEEALEDHFSANFSRDLSTPFSHPATTFASLFQESLTHMPLSDRERYLHMVVERTLERSHSIITLKLNAQDFLGSKKWATHLSPNMQANLACIHPLFAKAISRYLVSYSNTFINIKSLVIRGNKQISSSQLMPILRHLSTDCQIRHIEIEETKAGFTKKDIPEIAEFFSSHPSIQLSAPFKGEAKQKLFLKGISKKQLREE